MKSGNWAPGAANCPCGSTPPLPAPPSSLSSGYSSTPPPPSSFTLCPLLSGDRRSLPGHLPSLAPTEAEELSAAFVHFGHLGAQRAVGVAQPVGVPGDPVRLGQRPTGLKGPTEVADHLGDLDKLCALYTLQITFLIAG